MWLNQDTCSFECILQHLSIRDILQLGCVSREVNDYVRTSCHACVHLKRIENGDLPVITDARIFPRLVGFSQMCVKTVMKKQDTHRLTERWSDWEFCFLSTRTHTRRAFGRMLLRAKCLRHLGLDIATRSDDLISHMSGPLNAFVRRNPRIEGLTVSGLLAAKIVKPFRRTRIVSVTFDGEARSPHELSTIVSYLPSSIEKFTLIGRGSDCSAGHCMPTFLLHLVHKPNLKEIVCIRSIRACSVLCDAWAIVADFCENTTAHSLVVDVLRVDIVARLASRGFVKKLECAVVGCSAEHFKDWSACLPSGYRVRFEN